jgi:CRISPR-associated protein Csb2
MPSLLISVRYVGSRYHGLEPDGRPEWPPAPARLFQALVSAAAQGAGLAEEDKQALKWLERLDPPLIAAPARRKGQSFSHFMPNNDMDAVGGDPARISEIRRATKRFHPQIFDHETPFFYVWSFDDERDHAERLQEIASRLYQVGRGVDMAWAIVELLDEEEAKSRLATHPGAIHRPANSGGGRGLACPIPGSLHSLIDRYEKSRARFKPMIEAAPTGKDPSRTKVAGQTFAQPPKPRFRNVSYDSLPVRLFYELRDMTKNAGFLAWPLNEAVRLVETVRNDAAQRLREALPERTDLIGRVFGLCREATEADKASRIRILPLPSVGHQHADHGIRRLLVTIPPDCPFPAKDVEWAFSATGAIDRTTGEIQWMLVPAGGLDMLGHYGISENDQGGFRMWRTVTPMALPVSRPPGRKKGTERVTIEHDVATAVAQAVRHAGITSRLASIRVQREPFEAKSRRAEHFARGTRFPSARLWHVEITFARSVLGPLVAGDGRYLGLGLMKPVKQPEGVHAFVVVNGLSDQADMKSVTQALRRAVMALVQDELGPRTTLPTFFTGHEADGSPARRGGRAHLAFAFDAARHRLFIIAPHLLEGRPLSYEERVHLGVLDAALRDLRELRAGPAGLLKLESCAIAEDDDPLFAHATTWVTQTEYLPTRYSKGITPERAIVADVRLELRRRGFPIPTSIEKISLSQGPRGGLSARLKLVFSTAVGGPLLLGKACNFGSGLFVGSK